MSRAREYKRGQFVRGENCKTQILHNTYINYSTSNNEYYLFIFLNKNI